MKHLLLIIFLAVTSSLFAQTNVSNVHGYNMERKSVPVVEKPIYQATQKVTQEITQQVQKEVPRQWAQNIVVSHHKDTIKTVFRPTIITLKGDTTVIFAFDSYIIENEFKKMLKAFIPLYIQKISNYQNYKIDGPYFIGHASPEGKVDHNQKLSENRAKAVYNYSMELSKGKHNWFFRNAKVIGRGTTEPILDDEGEVDYILSRRVELITILKEK